MISKNHTKTAAEKAWLDMVVDFAMQSRWLRDKYSHITAQYSNFEIDHILGAKTKRKINGVSERVGELAIMPIPYEMHNIRGKNPHYDKDLEREFIIDIMKDSNRIWKFRNKIKNGDLDNTNLLEMEETIVMYLDDGSKINAIKFYREWMLDNMDTKVSLRECKDKVDAYDKSRKSQLI